MTENESLAPVYRYFTADLLSNKILAEIPFQKVSYSRAIKGAGTWSGQIPVIEDTKSLNVYDTTMPGQTALFAVRDGVCVWGGIIWSRDYNVRDRLLTVEASEFTSYFYHRRIWKTWSHQFGATVIVENGKAVVTFTNGASSSALTAGSSVKLDFYDPTDFGKNGYYQIAADPAPTTKSFSIIGARSQVKLTSYTNSFQASVFTTDGPHGFSDRDRVTLEITGDYAYLSGTYVISVSGGSESSTFSVPADVSVYQSGPASPLSGLVYRPLAVGQYNDVTVSVRADTYDYIRSLVEAVFNDFTDIEFANQYIEPGISYNLAMTQVIPDTYTPGLYFILTETDHNLVVGQRVQISNYDRNLNGEYDVVTVDDSKSFRVFHSGAIDTVYQRARTQTNKITARSIKNGVVSLRSALTTTYFPGLKVNVTSNFELDDAATSAFNGTHEVTGFSSSEGITYNIDSNITLPLENLTTPQINVPAANVVNKINYGISKGSAVSALGTGSIDYTNTSGQGTNVYTVTAPANGDGIRINMNIAGTNATDTFTVGLEIANVTGNAKPLAVDFQWSGIGTPTHKTLPDTPNRYALSIDVVGAANSTSGYLDIRLPNGGKFAYANVFAYAGAGPYTESRFYGGTPATDKYAYAWEGTAHESRSIRSNQPKRDLVLGNISGNVMTLTTEQAHPYTAGQSATITGANHYGRIIEKSYNNATKLATISTEKPHSLSTGDSVEIAGVRDSTMVTGYAWAAGTQTVFTNDFHNFAVGDVVTPTIQQRNRIVSYSIASNLATINFASTIPVAAGITSTQLYSDNLNEAHTVVGKEILANKATLTFGEAHSYRENDEIIVTNLVERSTVISKSVNRGLVVLTMSEGHNYVPGSQITVSGMGAPFDGDFKVLSTTTTRVIYELESKTVNIPTTAGTGSVFSTESLLNGSKYINAVTSTTVTFIQQANDSKYQSGAAIYKTDLPSVLGPSIANRMYSASVTGPTTATLTIFSPNGDIPTTNIVVPKDADQAQPVTRIPVQTSANAVTRVGPKSVTFSAGNPRYTTALSFLAANSSLTAASIFSGTYTITVVSPGSFTYPLDRPGNVLETPVSTPSYFKAPSIYNGTYTISSVDANANRVNFMKTHANIPERGFYGNATVQISPTVTVSSFGPFPRNSDLGIKFSSQEYSGKNIVPTLYRGFQLQNVGEALDTYSDSIDGFEYRIDCTLNPQTQTFDKTFVLLPIDFPNPPVLGEVSPISRFGADKLIFEYPGNINNVTIEESAENSATRFFVVGDNDLGPDAGPPFSVASATDMLIGGTNRPWPILDDDEQVDVDDETVLYAYAKRYLSEAAPPDATFTVSVNGSLLPVVGSYSPGDWCSLVIRNDFVQLRLQSDLEPRDTVLVRKIDVIKVTVPDGTTFPETVQLTLVPEWEVDKRAK